MKTHTADLLVFDMIKDPGMDGLDAYKHFLKIRLGQKAVIASGFSETSRAQEALSLGAGSYIKKSYTAENIGMAVRLDFDLFFR